MIRLPEADAAAFIERYWQKKPCLLRNALPGFTSPITPEELAGLACEEDVHCRLILEGDTPGDWSLRYGPFVEDDFLSLGESGYSLLVSECEKWIPGLDELLDEFRFIPDWRFDDLMISYAPSGGSVGAHVDQYDVFLLQAMGRRRWLYNENPTPEATHHSGLELKILEDFNPDQEAVLSPGDILYLPPGCAHHGIALDPCMTYSIGYRAPSAVDVLESLLLEREQQALEPARYADPGLETERHPAEITAREIERFRELALSVLQASPSVWRDTVGRMLSDSSATADPSETVAIALADLDSGDWMPHPETRLLFHRRDGAIDVYCNGEVYALPDEAGVVETLLQLCENRLWPHDLLQRAFAVEPLRNLLFTLASCGAIIRD